MSGAFPSEPVPVKVATSDLPKRAASAVVMLAVAGVALWLGGTVLQVFIALVAVVCFVEFVLLVARATSKLGARLAAIIAGAAYIGLAGFFLADGERWQIIGLVGLVICVDTFAYFFGRTIGGPKIAPRISPSKTWAGLLGGIVGAAAFMLLFAYWREPLCVFLAALDTPPSPANTVRFDGGCFGTNPSLGRNLVVALFLGCILAPVAQAGDFFESWLKRRAGKKDSSNLIPGHGGVFDRVDGLLPLALIFGLFGVFA